MKRKILSHPGSVPTLAPVAEFIDLTVDGVDLRISVLRREGERAPLLILHGFGGTKEDFADLMLYPPLQDRTIVTYDAPGAGSSECQNPGALSVAFLARAAMAIAARLEIDRCHVVGHSMGGLSALLLARQDTDRVLSLTSVEGNLAPEDCFLSGLAHTADGNPRAVLDACIAWLSAHPTYGSQIYSKRLPGSVQIDAVIPILRSMVDASYHGRLLESFISLSMPTLFVYGDSNNDLTYLTDLSAAGVEVEEIPMSGHFPMYSNPPALWRCIADFIDRVPE